jgi:protein SCO1/2
MALGARGFAMKRCLVSALLCAAGFGSVSAHAASPPDPSLYAFQERPGVEIPTPSIFSDADGRTVHLSELSHGLPLIVVLAYFHCSSLCGVVRSSLFAALHAAQLKAGRDYALAVVSIDPHEMSDSARAAKATDLAAFGPLGADEFVHYLTGSASDIRALTESVGFRDRFDPDSNQFVHPAGLVFLTSGGRVSNYLLGVGYTPSAVRSAVQRAGAGGIATAGSPLLLICFQFDPTTGRYSLEIMKVLRLAAILAVLTVAGMVFLLYRREVRPT